MFCKVCNTRLESGAPACPNCGAAISGRATEQPRPTVLASASPDLNADSADLDADSADLDADLDEVLQEAGVELERPPQPPGSAHGETLPIVPSFSLDPPGIRKQLVERPELLEPGLRIFANEKGTPVGVGYSTGVGPIDLLARDAGGGLVVVMVAEKGQGEDLVAEMLQRIGWVRKHLAGAQEQPRGIVLVDRLPENLGYAAAAVSNTISFKTYRVALCFEDVEF